MPPGLNVPGRADILQSNDPGIPKDTVWQLLERINDVQLEQQKTKERIDELTYSKQQFLLTLARLREEKNSLAADQERNEKLQAKLLSQLHKKEEEQLRLLEQLEKFRQQAAEQVQKLQHESMPYSTLVSTNNRYNANLSITIQQLWQEYKYGWMALLIAFFVLITGIISILTL